MPLLRSIDPGFHPAYVSKIEEARVLFLLFRGRRSVLLLLLHSLSQMASSALPDEVIHGLQVFTRTRAAVERSDFVSPLMSILQQLLGGAKGSLGLFSTVNQEKARVNDEYESWMSPGSVEATR